jgi:Zn-dependent protease
MEASDTHDAPRCAGCGTEIAPTLLSCPSCQTLVHAQRLKQLASDARAAKARGDPLTALEALRAALELLPPKSRQYETIAAQAAELSRQVDADTDANRPPSSEQSRRSGKWGAAAGVGTLGILLWKFKFALGFIVTKGKLLLAGLTKGSTFISMLLSLGVYWAAWGWKFALGLVLCIYVHEMGHVAALRRFGVKATAPMFLPGLGAVIRLKQYPATAREDARVGLAGPLWGLAAAVAAYVVYLATGWTSWAAIAKVGAWINLFNLMPVWQLDGGRGFRALSRRQRWLALAALALMWFLTAEGMLVLLLIFALFQAAGGKSAPEPDRTALIQYVFLVVTLSAMCLIEVSSASA